MVISDWYKFDFEGKNEYETGIKNLENMKVVLDKAYDFLRRKLFILDRMGLDNDTRDDALLLSLAVLTEKFNLIIYEVGNLVAAGHIV